jgi:hypothetical protein
VHALAQWLGRLHPHQDSIMARSFPPGRIGLKQFLADAEISKNTFFLRYRHDPKYVALLDIREDRDHRLHFPMDAGHRLRNLRDKPRHGNAGRVPRRPCPSCGAILHPRHTACVGCGASVTPSAHAPEITRRRSTAIANFRRGGELRALRGEA